MGLTRGKWSHESNPGPPRQTPSEPICRHAPQALNHLGYSSSQSSAINLSIFQPPEEKEALLLKEEYQEEMSESTFLYLTLDLPTAPLYKDEKEQLIIPQVPLFNILGKFNGNTEKVQICSYYSAG